MGPIQEDYTSKKAVKSRGTVSNAKLNIYIGSLEHKYNRSKAHTNMYVITK